MFLIEQKAAFGKVVNLGTQARQLKFKLKISVLKLRGTNSAFRFPGAVLGVYRHLNTQHQSS